MKYTYTPAEQENPRKGGSLLFKPETHEERFALLRHFKLYDLSSVNGAKDYAAALMDDAFTYHSPYNPKRPWFRIEATLPEEWLAPYTKKLAQWTGFSGAFPDADLSSILACLKHTIIIESARSEGGKLHLVGYDKSEDWNGVEAADRALASFVDYAKEELGARKLEREFIPAANGQYKHNPNYMKRQAPHPHLANAALFNWLFAWWRANHANEKQERILRLSEQLSEHIDWKACQGYQECSFLAYSDFKYLADPADPKAHDWDGKGTKFLSMKWGEFQALK